MKHECPKCNSENTSPHDRNASENRARMKCLSCGHTWSIPKGDLPEKQHRTSEKKPRIGMTLNQFREQYDTEYKLDQALSELEPDFIYEKQDVLKLAGLPIGTPGAATILESRKQYYGKINSKMLFSHPDTIKILKDQAKLN